MFNRSQNRVPADEGAQHARSGSAAASPGAGESDLDALLTVAGAEARIEGVFEIADSLHIECEILGRLEVGGRIVIGEPGVVRADVRTVDALIMGTYEGDMVATGDVRITSTGRVTGNLKTDSIVIEKGGSFTGNVDDLDGEAATVDAAPDTDLGGEPGRNGAGEPAGADGPGGAEDDEEAFLARANTGAVDDG